VTEAIRRQLVAGGLGVENRVVTMPGGVDVDRFRPDPEPPRDHGIRATLGLPRDVPIIGLVSGFRVMKGHQTVVEAAARLAAGGRRFHLLLIGQGPFAPKVRAQVEAAGLGDGVANVITNAPKDASAVVEALIAHKAVRRISFTGSTRVGRLVAEIAARHLKPVLLELGGKAPLVILDDADLDEAVKAAAFGAFANQGQICMSTERILVDEKVADTFAQKFAAKAKSLPSGDPRNGEVVLGSVVDLSTVQRVRKLVEDAVGRGAKLLAGGESNGTIMPAIVLDHVTPDMEIFREESFGPSVSITRFKTVEEAIRMANDSEYGLSAAVFGRDISRAIEVAKRIESGICHINGPTVHDEAQMPFGGVKGSGYGRFGGKAAIDEFTELRWITIQTSPRQYPF